LSNKSGEEEKISIYSLCPKFSIFVVIPVTVALVGRYDDKMSPLLFSSQVETKTNVINRIVYKFIGDIISISVPCLRPVVCYGLVPAFVGSPQRSFSIWLVTEHLEWVLEWGS
jgi:hypothetical protein